MTKLSFFSTQLTLLALFAGSSSGRFVYAQSESASELLQKLQEVDDAIMASFSAEGTKLAVPFDRIGATHPPTRLRWKFSIDDGKFGYEERVEESLQWEVVVGPDGPIPPRNPQYADSAFDLRVKVFLSKKALAEFSYFAGQIPEPGQIIPTTDDDPAGATRGCVMI
ncbi:MAG: hypothetical protein ACR2NU_15445, partial [Aeoliella sp.]